MFFQKTRYTKHLTDLITELMSKASSSHELFILVKIEIKLSREINYYVIIKFIFQKQSARGILLKRCSQKFCKIDRKTPVPEKTPLAQLFSYESCEIFKNTFTYGTPPVAALIFVFRTLSNIYDVVFYEKNHRLKALNYFSKKAPS